MADSLTPNPLEISNKHYTLTYRSLLTPLSSTNYRRLLISTALWQQSLAIWMLTAGWLLLELTDSALVVAMLSFWRRAAQLLVGFFAGPIGDRLGRRATMLLVQYVNLSAFTIILTLFWLEWLSPWHMLAAMFVIGISWTVDMPARTALTPDLVGKAQTTDAMLLENFMQGILGGVGPFVGGWLLALHGPIGGFGVLFIMSVVHIVLLTDFSKRDIPRQAVVARESVWVAVGQGMRYIGGHRLLLGVTLVSAVLNILIFPSMSLMPVFARDVLGRGPAYLGLLTAGYSIGTFVGLYLSHHLRARIGINQIFIVGALLECCTLALFAASPYYPLSWLLLFTTGVGHAGFHTMRNVILLTQSSDEMRGRAMSTVVLTQGAGLPGELQTGLLGEQIGAPMTVGLQASGAALLTAIVAVAIPALRRTETQNKEPQD